jgi:endonuclease/exonuclease/phosphatase family metal-dependent hydrolase
MSSLRVASYNLRGLKDDAAAAAAVVRALRPDVLLLQEVPRYPGSSYAIAALARDSGMLWSGRTRAVSGTSLMSSLRVSTTDARDHRLAVGLRENPRSYTLARVRVPDGPMVTVASVHLPLKEEQRLAHARTVLTEIAHHPDIPQDEPLVVGGDLNEGPDGAAWAVLGGVAQEVTGADPSFPAHRPHRHIDAIFARGHSDADPGDRRLLEEVPVADASDHLPVWVDLQF